MAARLRLSVLAAIVSVCCASQRAEAQQANLVRRLEAQQAMIERLDGDLEQAQRDLERVRGDERDAAHEAVAAANRLSLIEHTLTELAKAESVLVSDVRDVRSSGERTRRQIEERTGVVERRVRALYVSGRMHPFRRALLATSVTHWVAARQYLATLNRRDKIDIDHLRHDRSRLDSLGALYADQQRTLDTLLARKVSQRDGLARAEREARRLVRTVRSSRRLAESAAAELEVQREAGRGRIESYLGELAKAGSVAAGGALGSVSVASPTDLVSQKGRLPWPIGGPVLSRFGRKFDRASKTWTRNRGIDIGAPDEASVLAVASGQVVAVDWYRGYGSFVIVAHGGNYYTLYAHLAAVTVRRGDRLRQGQVIGLSGGSDTIGETKVHFELLAGHEALDPLDWLVPNPHDPS